jgi:hypothetical protein
MKEPNPVNPGCSSIGTGIKEVTENDPGLLLQGVWGCLW